jgi:CRISPR-associated protein Csb2
MSEALCISVTFLDSRFHGRSDGGSPEWPPSPMRLYQSLVAGNGAALDTGSDVDAALRWLETQPPPTVLAPPSKAGVSCPLYVPNNAMDLVAKSWVRGNTDATIAEHRTLKTVRPTHLRGGDTVHYLWPIDSSDADPPPVGPLAQAVERMVALGWGMDLVVAQCRVLSSGDSVGEGLERWDVAQAHATSTLRCPVLGSLDALVDRHAAFLDRLADDTFHPVPPLTAYRAVGYRMPADPITLPTAVFELRHDDGKFCRYSQRKLIHIAGMVRHLAKEAMQKSRPADVADDWIERYVVGHRDGHTDNHRQFSYLPLPSIGHTYVDQAVRRVMVAAPVGDDAWLEHLAVRLAGQQLKPEPARNDEFGEQEPPTLMRVYRDKVARRYTAPANMWASVSPVILPGHDDKKPAKTRKLIEAALSQSGIDQPCTYEWSPHSRFRNSLSAHKYHTDRDTGMKRWQFENVKDYLRGKTWVHLTLTFNDELKGPGPLIIGAGRHCGFGLMAGVDK